MLLAATGWPAVWLSVLAIGSALTALARLARIGARARGLTAGPR